MRSNPWFAGAVVGLVILLGPARDARPQEATAVSAEQALQKLKDGNERFAKDMLERKDVGAARRAALSKGQKPFAVILCCADSRVTPEIIFNQGLGDVFVLRVAGNIADPFVLGSIEFAVSQLKTPLVVVLGHESCGAVAAGVAKAEFPGALGKLIREIHVGADLPPERAKALQLAIKNNVVHHTALLTQRSEALKEAAARGQVRIVGGVYELSSGKVQWLESK
jgi:carbonic anhydrase